MNAGGLVKQKKKKGEIINDYKFIFLIFKTIIFFYLNIRCIFPLNVQLVKKENEYYA